MGSPREALLIMLWLQREQMEHAQTFALIQTMVNREKASEAFEDYKKIRFPWIESTKAKEKLDHIARLRKEVECGALAITPIASPRKINSRLHRVVSSTPRTPEEVKREQAKIYSKIGTAIPR